MADLPALKRRESRPANRGRGACALAMLVGACGATSRPANEPTPGPVVAPNEPAVASDDPYACEAHADCVIACPDVPGCCGWPCGCNHAIRRDHADAFVASYGETCERAPDCPAVACAYQQPGFAGCANGRCVVGQGAMTTTLPR